MPQMSTINWIMMFIFFSSLFYSSLSYIYFFYVTKPKMINMTKKDNKMSESSWNKCW